MLTKRLISAAVIVSSLLLLIWLDYYLGRTDGVNRPGLILSVVGVVAAGMAAGELATMWRQSIAPVRFGLFVVLTVFVGAAASFKLWWPSLADIWFQGPFDGWLLGLLIVLVLFFAAEMGTFGSVTHQTDRLGRHLLGVFYLTMPLAFLVEHRVQSGDNGGGLVAFLAVVVTVKFSDVAAYFVGKTWGHTRMAPTLSPKKTIEGMIGGLVGGILGAGLVLLLIGPRCLTEFVPTWWFVIIYGTLVTLAGMFGDLAESFLKRDSQTKDSSVWLPGLGGILDIVDSLIFALPVSHLLLTLKGQA